MSSFSAPYKAQSFKGTSQRVSKTEMILITPLCHHAHAGISDTSFTTWVISWRKNPTRCLFRRNIPDALEHGSYLIISAHCDSLCTGPHRDSALLLSYTISRYLQTPSDSYIPFKIFCYFLKMSTSECDGRTGQDNDNLNASLSLASSAFRLTGYDLPESVKCAYPGVGTRTAIICSTVSQ